MRKKETGKTYRRASSLASRRSRSLRRQTCRDEAEGGGNPSLSVLSTDHGRLVLNKHALAAWRGEVWRRSVSWAAGRSVGGIGNPGRVSGRRLVGNRRENELAADWRRRSHRAAPRLPRVEGPIDRMRMIYIEYTTGSRQVHRRLKNHRCNRPSSGTRSMPAHDPGHTDQSAAAGERDTPLRHECRDGIAFAVLAVLLKPILHRRGHMCLPLKT